MVTHQSKNALEQKLYHSFMLLSTLVILLSMGVTLYFDMTRQRNQVDASIGGAAAYIAGLPNVIEMLQAGYPDQAVVDSLDSLCDTIADISMAVVCNKDGLRFYHTDRQKTGETYVDGEEKPILEGAAPYITTGYGTMGMQRRAFHSIVGENGKIIGFAMVSVFTGVITARFRSILAVHLAVLCVLLLVSMFLTRTIIKFLSKSLMGLQPEELLSRYLQQDEVLSAVAEGLVASDAQGKVLFVNPTAQALFGKNTQLIGKSVLELFPDSRQDAVMHTGKIVERRSWIVQGHTVLASQIPIWNGEGSVPQGVLTILYDRTEMLRMSDELFGARSMIEALRSYNHEFSNKLHVILGYLETGKSREAIRFIVNSNLISSQLICKTADQIRVSELCALMIGKILYAAERGIHLTLAEGSCCIEQDLLIQSSDMVTLIGNLLENAIDELSAAEKDVKEIECGLYCRPDCNLFICEDTGRGIPSEALSKVFENGFSTKGHNRGTGLFAVNTIVKRYGGKIDIETEPGEGTGFTITFTREETW